MSQGPISQFMKILDSFFSAWCYKLYLMDVGSTDDFVMNEQCSVEEVHAHSPAPHQNT